MFTTSWFYKLLLLLIFICALEYMAHIKMFIKIKRLVRMERCMPRIRNLLDIFVYMCTTNPWLNFSTCRMWSMFWIWYKIFFFSSVRLLFKNFSYVCPQGSKHTHIYFVYMRCIFTSMFMLCAVFSQFRNVCVCRLYIQQRARPTRLFVHRRRKPRASSAHTHANENGIQWIFASAK